MMNWKLILIISATIATSTSCMRATSFEMEEIAKDVLQQKNHEGIDIIVKPLYTDKK